jgi:hypothetical protein
MPKTNDLAGGRLLADADAPAPRPSLDNAVLKVVRDNPLDGFIAERELISGNQAGFQSARGWGVLHLAVIVLAVVAIAELVLLVRAWGRQPVRPAVATTGAISIESTPTGAAIAIDGRQVAKTPWFSALKPGAYNISVTSGDVTRQLPLNIRAGDSQRVYFNESAPKIVDVPAAPLARVPAAVANRFPPPIAVPAATPAASAASAAGWISISSPIDLQLFENAALIGSSRTARIALPVGRHVIRATNSSLGFETTTTLQVGAGSVARANIDVPLGVLNVNALPWADVAIDGDRLGLTPLANVSLPIGSHEVVFSHPQLGERRQTVVVTVSGPNRVSVDLR